MAGHAEQARHFAEDFRMSRPNGFRLQDFLQALLRYHARQEDKALWREGYLRAGLIPA